MPRRQTDLSDQIEAIVREATAQIVALVEGEREALLESLQQAVTAIDATLQDRGGLPEALRAAMPASPLRPAAAKRPPRDQWVRTADVVVTLRGLLSRRKRGFRIAELREETQFSDMQLHRALRELRDAGEVTKEGELRRTVYRYTGPRRATARTKAAPSAKATPKGKATRAKVRSKTAKTPKRSTPRKSPAKKGAPVRPPRAHWVSTDDVKQAAKKVLRRRKKGLRMAELSELTGYSDKQLHRAIVALVEEGVVQRIGKLRNMRYVMA